jgi:hypothetical protein
MKHARVKFIDEGESPERYLSKQLPALLPRPMNFLLCIGKLPSNLSEIEVRKGSQVKVQVYGKHTRGMYATRTNAGSF